jgi:hypothetical protein
LISAGCLLVLQSKLCDCAEIGSSKTNEAVTEDTMCERVM